MYTVQKIAEVVNGQLIKADKPHAQIKALFFDSRRISKIKGSLFFAIPGSHHDGHDYLEELLEQGCNNFVIQDGEVIDNLQSQSDVNLILVEDVVGALQTLASFHRKHFNIPVIGVTGSNGKTIIKEWLYQLLYRQVNVLRSPRSFNSQIGVPLSVWELNETHELGVFEAGISTTEEMAHLEAIIQPTIGIFANIGQAHQAGFTDMRQKVMEKLKLFKNCHTLIYCKDYGLIEEAVQSQLQEGFFDNDDLTLYSWSKQGNADLEIRSIQQDQGITQIKGFWKEEEQEIAIPFTDPASIENAIHCWLTLLVMGCEGDMIQEGIEALSPVRMRMEMKNGVNGCTLINDSYNSDLLSINNALDFLNQQSQHSKKTVILSDILQAGMREKELYQEVARILESKAIDRLIGIGPAINRNHEIFNANEFFNSTEDFLNGYGPNDFQNEAILIKGARKFHFEDISKLLQQKAHQTVLEINLEAMIHNLNVYRSYLKSGTKVMVMVKAFAYGSGSYEIANILQFHKADYLAVAYADEGIHLREAGIQLPIMVMNPEEESFERMVAYKLEPEIYSIRQLEQFAKATAGNQANKILVHIKLDTGMHRLGFTEDELPALLSTLEKASQIKIQSVFSHLVASDEPEEDDFTQKQIDAFERMVDKLQNHLQEDFLKHILNTGGVVRHSKAQYDMVRLGLGVYGIDTTGHVAALLRTVSTLKTTVAQLKHLKPGDTVGYGRAGKITKTTTIATLSIGYADGFNRLLSNGQGYVMVNGTPAPVVGNVCMDMTMVDVTGIGVREGQEVVVFGDKPNIQEIAALMDTIPYEVLTNIAQRVKRVYLNE